MAERVPVEKLNRLVKLGQRRVEELEPKLAALLEPILRDAGTTAARNFRANATDHLTASAVRADRERIAMLGRDGVRAILPSLVLTGAAADVASNSTMIALKPLPEEADSLAMIGGEEPEDIHVTLAYLGEYDGDLDQLAEILGDVARNHAPLSGTVGGIGSFSDNGKGRPAILLPSVPGLVELRVAVTEALVGAGFDYGRNHGYLPHLTVSYEDNENVFPSLGDAGKPLHFDDLWIVRGNDETRQIPLNGMAPVTAAGEPTPWSAPAPDEIIDVDALVKTLRGKTDPVRLASIEAIMDPALAAAGLSFDVTNPLTAKVLAQSGSQITEIARTTQLNVMRIIRAAHDEGLSIPSTAKAIQAGMDEASTVRATLIARTELVGAVNGGSLAATQIVSDATGIGYSKVWLTAPGAKYPRHEDYPDLDGQTTTLEGTFTVGEDQLRFPGDPDGDPGEVCNCRCTLVYEENGQEVATTDAESVGEFSPADLASQAGADAVEEIAQAGIPQLATGEAKTVDTISVGNGPPLSAQTIEKIQSLKLDQAVSPGPVAKSILGGAADTRELYQDDGVWKAEREALHRSILDAHFADKVPPPPEERSAYFTAGGGASGKSGALFNVGGKDLTVEDLEKHSGTIVVDPDRIKEMIPEYRRIRDAGDPSAASVVHEESSQLSKDVVAEAQRRGFSYVLDSTGSSKTFPAKLAEAIDQGYDTKVTMVSIPTNEAIVRSIARGDRSGRYLNLGPLKSAHKGASLQLDTWKDQSGISEWRLYDNQNGLKLVAEGDGGGDVTVYDPTEYDAILAKGEQG